MPKANRSREARWPLHRRWSWIRLAPPVVLASASTTWAQSTNALALHASLPDMGLSALRALSALVIVLVVFLGGVWVYRNGQRLAWRKTGSPRLNVIEARSLGNRYALYVVGYDQERLLVGCSPAGINLLTPLPPANEPAPATPPLAPTERATPAAPAPLSFALCLHRLLARKEKPE